VLHVVGHSFGQLVKMCVVLTRLRFLKNQHFLVRYCQRIKWTLALSFRFNPTSAGAGIAVASIMTFKFDLGCLFQPHHKCVMYILKYSLLNNYYNNLYLFCTYIQEYFPDLRPNHTLITVLLLRQFAKLYSTLLVYVKYKTGGE
jgi:hypothetical protein